MFNDPQWVDVEVSGEISGEKYFGRFLVKPFLTHAERADAVRLSETYARGIVDDIYERDFLRNLAFLKFYIVKTDVAWWKDGLDFYDHDPITKLSEIIGEMRKKILDRNKKEVEAPVVEEKKS